VIGKRKNNSLASNFLQATIKKFTTLSSGISVFPQAGKKE